MAVGRAVLTGDGGATLSRGDLRRGPGALSMTTPVERNLMLPNGLVWGPSTACGNADACPGVREEPDDTFRSLTSPKGLLWRPACPAAPAGSAPPAAAGVAGVDPPSAAAAGVLLSFRLAKAGGVSGAAAADDDEADSCSNWRGQQASVSLLHLAARPSSLYGHRGACCLMTTSEAGGVRMSRQGP